MFGRMEIGRIAGIDIFLDMMFVLVLLVFTYRPGYPNPFGDRSYFTRIVPAPLSADDSASMAAQRALIGHSSRRRARPAARVRTPRWRRSRS